jgi:effector-binding domain-containing protein
MQKPEVQEIDLLIPIKATGKTFIGDYAKAQQYIIELQAILNQKAVPFIPNRVMGIYYDNPQEKKSEELRSFHGLFLSRNNPSVGKALTEVSLSGKHLYIKVSGDPMKSIYEGYGALFEHMQKQGITLESNTGYQVSTFENGVITTEIYMKIL